MYFRTLKLSLLLFEPGNRGLTPIIAAGSDWRNSSLNL